jgi:hypothetical protein
MACTCLQFHSATGCCGKLNWCGFESTILTGMGWHKAIATCPSMLYNTLACFLEVKARPFNLTRDEGQHLFLIPRQLTRQNQAWWDSATNLYVELQVNHLWESFYRLRRRLGRERKYLRVVKWGQFNRGSNNLYTLSRNDHIVNLSVFHKLITLANARISTLPVRISHFSTS